LKEEKEGGKEGLKELLSSMLELLGKTGKAEASLLHHLTPEVLDARYERSLEVEEGGWKVLMLRCSRHGQGTQERECLDPLPPIPAGQPDQHSGQVGVDRPEAKR
jgi:hypothetical protein